MIYSIYTSAGIKRTDFEGDSNCTHDYKVQTNNELNLSFILHDYVELDVNDYIYLGSTKFVLMKAYRPEMTSTKEYKYDVKFYGPENIAGTAVFLDSDYQPITSYYDTPTAQLAYIVACINRVVGETRYHVGEVISSAPVNVSYPSGCTCLEALSTLSKAVNTEWWLDGVNFNLSKCEYGDPVTLGYGTGLLRLTKELSETDDFYTRLIPQGSSRNIIPSKYGHNTLQLPGGAKWVDRNVSLYGIKEKYEADAFADIYPRFTGMVGVVRTEVRTIDEKEVTVYFFTAPDIPFNPDDYSVPNLVKHVVFKSGDLQGQDFEANWNQDNGEWELITQYPSETTQLPGGNVVPITGDTYTVYNLDMPDEYYPIAEQEYLAAVNALLDDSAIDYSIYKSPTDFNYLDENSIDLTVGRRVHLLSDIYFPEGYRDSRIIRIVRKLDRLNDMDIEIANTIVKGAYSTLKSDVSELRNSFDQQLSNEVINIIRTTSKDDLTDDNILSSLRAVYEMNTRILKEIKLRALSRLNNDTAAEVIQFLKGLTVGDNPIDSLIAGSGTLIDGNRIQTERLEVRGSMTVFELIFNRLSAQEGDASFSESGLIEDITEIGVDTYRLQLRKRTDTDFTAFDWNDILYGSVNDLATGGGNYRTSWMRVVGVNAVDNYIEVVLYPNNEVPGGMNYQPEKLMVLTRRGNTTDIDRQSFWYISSYEKCICMLDGVTKPILEENNYSIIIGKLKQLSLFQNLPINYRQSYLYCRGIAVQDRFQIDVTGKPIYELVDRGIWSLNIAQGEKYFFKQETKPRVNMKQAQSIIAV